MQIFGSSGTRGEVGAEFTPEFVVGVAGATATVVDADSVALARDTRTTGALFADAAAAGITATGTDVTRLGVLPTPGLAQFCDAHSVPGLVVTASHNPPEYNGLKLIDATGSGFSVDRLEAVEACLLEESFQRASWDAVGRRERIDGAADAYAADVCGALDGAAIADANLTVAVDPGNGAGCDVTPRIYRELGCDVVTLNANPDGEFPGRPPEPVPENLADLGRLVRASGADVGIAHDGDADRAVFVDETGRVVPAESSFAALVEATADTGDTVVSAVNVSKRVVDACDRVGADLELTPIGATNIATRIKELWDDGHRVPIAGEGNGGVFFPPYRLARDGAYVAGKFLELLAAREASVSELVAPYSDYETVRSNLAYETETERDALLAAAEAYATEAANEPGVEQTTIDGFRVEFADAWLLVRPSGTEPKVRVYAESTDRARARELVETVTERLDAARES